MGTFVRYVGNRLHVLFHLAGVLVAHHGILLTFTEQQCTGGGLLRTNVMKDLKDDKIMAQVWSFGIVGKVLSGPWMTRFYSSEMSNLEMGPLIQQCVGKLHAWIESPSSLLHPSEDVFNTELQPEQDGVLAALMSFEGAEYFQLECIKVALEASLCVLKRQLQEFIHGDYSKPTEEMRERATGAPTHNMSSERNLGCFDRLWRRAPNATVGFLTGKVKCNMNKTLEWLDSKSVDEKNLFIEFVVGEAKEECVKKFSEQKGLMAEIAGRKLEVAEQRKRSKLCSMIRQSAIKDRLQQYLNDTVSCWYAGYPHWGTVLTGTLMF